VVDALPAPDGQSVRIAGLAMHSALMVHRIETLRETRSLRVRVLLRMAKEGASGSFETVVQVPKDVDRILFGDEGVVIWERPAT